LPLPSLRLPWRLCSLAVPICLTAEAGDGLNSQEAKARSPTRVGIAKQCGHEPRAHRATAANSKGPATQRSATEQAPMGFWNASCGGTRGAGGKVRKWVSESVGNGAIGFLSLRFVPILLSFASDRAGTPGWAGE
jgi:hypothetical protein